jgi:DNA (cytosine-5)-methyltransferase 1
MRDIESVPLNGLKTVSTFSGCGGSCLGLRAAGFEALWASEFIPSAAETYRANHPGVYLDTGDIRSVSADSILDRIGLSVGELDLLEGSPPCASFSTAGKREAGWGKVKKYSETTQRVDDLFYEYIRLIDGIRPKVFFAENVLGLVKGTAKGYFLDILAQMKSIGYNVEARALDAEWLGVPQRRKRIFFVGVRNDLNLPPAFPQPLPYFYSVREAFEGLPKGYSPNLHHYAIGRDWAALKWGGQNKVTRFNLARQHPDRPSWTILQTDGNPGAAGIVHYAENRKLTIAELRRVCGFPDDFILTGTWSQQYERLGRAVPPPVTKALGETLYREVFSKL